MNVICHLLPCQHLRISRSYISRMLSPGIIVPVDSNDTSVFLIFFILRHVSELSRAVLTAVRSPLEQAKCIVNAIKHLQK